MKNKTISFVSTVLLIVYGTITFVAVPFHHHDDSLFATGSGHQTVAHHDDALHCRHHVIESCDDCTICSVISHSTTAKVIAVLPQFDPAPSEYISAFSFTTAHDTYSSFSRRGPPAQLG
jgi:hypothetical protein